METLSDLQKNCAEKLKALKPSLTSKDKKAAAAELEVDLFTVYRYLNGEVKNLDTGTALLTFLNPRVEARKTALA